MADTRLEKLQEKEAQIKAQIKQEKAKLKSQERKARNHRLIEIGAMVESALGRPVEKDEMERLNSYFRQQREWIERSLLKEN